MTNRAADSWANAQAIANETLRERASDGNSAACIVGRYVVEWDDEEQMSEQVVGSMRDLLRKQDLTLTSDDKGLRVARRDEDR